MSAFPFAPEQLARLASFSLATRAGAGAKPPIAGELFLEEGFADLPRPDGAREWMWVHSGLHLAWTPAPEMDGAILVQFGGEPSEHDRVGVGLAAFITRDGLRRLLTDLGSIADQLEPGR